MNTNIPPGMRTCVFDKQLIDDKWMNGQIIKEGCRFCILEYEPRLAVSAVRGVIVEFDPGRRQGTEQRVVGRRGKKSQKVKKAIPSVFTSKNQFSVSWLMFQKAYYASEEWVQEIGECP